MKLPPRVSRRAVRNQLAFLNGQTQMEAPSARSGPRGRQPESAVNDSVKEWANTRNGLLYRNRRGVIDMPGGGKLPFGLGPNGYGDLVGYLTIEITPELLGRKVAVFSMIESKTPVGRIEPHQEKYIQEVRAAGGIAGFARQAEDSEAIYQRWREGR